jgi:hypothetical protein
MTAYPTSIYAPRAKENKAGVVYDPSKKTVGYVEDVTKLDNEVVSIETILGLNANQTSVSIAERIKGIRSLSDAIVDSIIIKGNKLGIGTNNPTERLHIVNGSLKISNAVIGAGLAPLVVQNTNAYADPYTQYAQVWLNSSGSPMAWVRNDEKIYAVKMLAGQLQVNAGTVSSPAIISNYNTGLFFPATDSIAFANAGVEIMRILKTGKVGIGTTIPSEALHVVGNIKTGGYTFIQSTSGLAQFTSSGGNTYFDYDGIANFRAVPSYNTNLSILSNGDVGFGTESATSKIDINSDKLRLRTAKTPATAGSAGNAGDQCWDSLYLYVCIATNTWRRVAHTSW